ncbi:MAG: PEGA domain-containing protein [Polyangiaceae bacterium]
MKSRKLIIGAAVVSFALLGAAGAAVAGEPEASDKDRADKAAELYKQANKLYDDQQLTLAEALYRKAWDLQKTFGIASNFGAVELELGKGQSAATLLQYALSHFPAKGKPETRAALEARLEKAKQLVGTVRVRVTSAGAEVLVDGKSLGVAPITDEVFLDPGNHTFEAKQKGHKDAKQTVLAIAAKAQDVTLSLPDAPKASGPLPPPVTTAQKPPSKWPVPGVVMAAVGVVGLGVGGAFIGAAEVNKGDAIRLRDKLQAANVSCPAGSTECDSLRATTQRADMFGNTGIGLLIGGGVLAAAGAAYILWPGAKIPAPGQDKATVHATFAASPQGGSVTLVGSF